MSHLNFYPFHREPTRIYSLNIELFYNGDAVWTYVMLYSIQILAVLLLRCLKGLINTSHVVLTNRWIKTDGMIGNFETAKCVSGCDMTSLLFSLALQEH